MAVALVVLVLVRVAAAEVPLPASPLPAAGGECVAPVDDMRRNHMRYLLHQRQGTVHQGLRTARFSLVGCIDCHAQKNEQGGFVPVDAPGQFCQSCHAYAAVEPDCFQCHATRPGEDAATVGGAGAVQFDPADGAAAPEVSR